MFLKRQGLSLRVIASELNRSPSTLSRELQRRAVEGRPYDAEAVGLAARSARLHCRPRRKLIEGTDLHEVVVDMLRNKWSPQQISGTLKTMFPHHPEFQVSHETVYKAIYAQPHGELRKELITCLRQGQTKRRPRAGGVDRRQQIPDLVSIHRVGADLWALTSTSLTRTVPGNEPLTRTLMACCGSTCRKEQTCLCSARMSWTLFPSSLILDVESG